MAVVAALTAQNTLGVSDLAEVSPAFVGAQLDAVLIDLPPDSAKTGRLMTAGVIDIVSQKLKQYAGPNLVVDPVMTSKSGVPLLNRDALYVFRRALLRLAFIVTPHTDEAASLTGSEACTVADLAHSG